MSWKMINRILGMAAIDQHFWQALQKDPLAAIQEHGFELTSEEQSILSQIARDSLPDFSQSLLNTLAPDVQQMKHRKNEL